MKNSKRNKANQACEAEKRAAGKPPASKFERKRMSPEELRERELAVARQART